MHSSMCPTVHGVGFVHCGQIAWKKWPTNRHAHVSRWLMLSCHWQLWVLLPMCLFDCLLVFSFVGRWLLPSLVDMGDICCHYWQHILVHFRVPWSSNDSQRVEYIISYWDSSPIVLVSGWHASLVRSCKDCWCQINTDMIKKNISLQYYVLWILNFL